MLEPVHFDFNRDDILPSDTVLLERQAEILRDNPSLQDRRDDIVITAAGGHLVP